MKPLRPNPRKKIPEEPRAQATRPALRAGAEMQKVRELAKILVQYELSELEIDQGGLRVRLRRGGAHALDGEQVGAITAPLLAPTPVIGHPLPSPTPASAEPAPAATPIEVPGTFITSPFVGTFYRAPSPEASVFCEIGQRVRKGQVLCIVEAMKLMNEIESDVDGTIAEILVENGQPVEYGERLFRLGP